MIEYRTGDKVTVTWPTEPDDADNAVLVAPIAFPDQHFEPTVEGVIDSSMIYNNERVWTVRFENMPMLHSWTCRAKWFAPVSGPW